LSYEPYSGAEYRFPCAVSPGDKLSFQAHQFGTTEPEVRLWLTIEDENGEELGAVAIGPDHLAEFHAAINAALGAVADNGIRLIEEQEQAALRRLLGAGLEPS
jgi:hypothetical protein